MARSVPEPTPSSNRTVALVIAAVLALLVAVAVFWFWPKATRVPETVAIATGLLGGQPGAWRLSAIDVDGLDLCLDEAVLRLAFTAPARDAERVRSRIARV